jgi:hypothetical protein
MQIAQAPVLDAGGESGARLNGPERVYRDEHGGVWLVREREIGPTREGLARRSLIFETDCVIRRVYEYPPDWHVLPDADLRRLSQGR